MVRDLFFFSWNYYPNPHIVYFRCVGYVFITPSLVVMFPGIVFGWTMNVHLNLIWETANVFLFTF